MNPGDLNKRITIQKVSGSSQDDIAVETETWTDYKTVWAGVSNLYGKEYFAAAAVQAEKTVKFIIRYLSGITEDMRIVYNNKIYNIDFVDNIKYGNTFMEIKAMEVD